MVGRQAFPIGKVTFQGQTVKLREGMALFLGESVAFGAHNFHLASFHNFPQAQGLAKLAQEPSEEQGRCRVFAHEKGLKGVAMLLKVDV